jgi:AcrR family transcriptional regulator
MTGNTANQMRNKILDEASALFVSRGYNGISMREIAESSGVSKANLYYHFKDKQDLFLAILTDNLNILDDLIQQSCKPGTSVCAQLGNVVASIFNQSPRQRAMIRLASQEMSQLDKLARVEFGRIYQEKFIGRIEALLDEGIHRGELRQVDIHQATWILLGMMYPFFSGGQGQSNNPDNQVIELIMDTFFEGLSTHGQSKQQNG